MLKPKPLEKGDTIGIIAPASSAEKKEINKGKEVLENMGFKIKMGESSYSKYAYLSSKDEIRAADINNMFADDEVDGIMCIRGGYGTPRILNKIDYDIIKKNPKVFVGYSDITALHIAFNQKSHLVTFHGPMVASELASKFDEFTRKTLMDLITKQEVDRLNNPNNEDIKSLVGGKAEGTIVGGNLTLICATLGTPYEIDTKGKILFLEEVGEEPYRLDRNLTQLYLAGKLRDAEGLILGDWKECKPKRPNRSLTLMEVFEDILAPLNKPTIYNLRAGHCSPMVTIPFGTKVILDADNCNIDMKESAIK